MSESLMRGEYSGIKLANYQTIISLGNSMIPGIQLNEQRSDTLPTIYRRDRSELDEQELEMVASRDFGEVTIGNSRKQLARFSYLPVHSNRADIYLLEVGVNASPGYEGMGLATTLAELGDRLLLEVAQHMPYSSVMVCAADGAKKRNNETSSRTGWTSLIVQSLGYIHNSDLQQSLGLGSSKNILLKMIK